MDVNDLRIGVTMLSFIAFAGIVAWVWLQPNAAGFNEAAQLPFLDDSAISRDRPMAPSDGSSP